MTDGISTFTLVVRKGVRTLLHGSIAQPERSPLATKPPFGLALIVLMSVFILTVPTVSQASTKHGLQATEEQFFMKTIPDQAQPANTIFTKIPSIGITVGETENITHALVNLLMIGFILVLGVISLRSMHSHEPSGLRRPQARHLLRAWESIELLYQYGDLDVIDYGKLRTEIKEELIRLLLKEQG